MPRTLTTNVASRWHAGPTIPWIRWLGPQNVGVNMAVRGNLVRAQELFREARDVARAANDVVDEGITLNVMAHAALVCRRV
jgi:hypothetical protein